MTGYPDTPGHRGVHTSIDAADMASKGSRGLRALVLRTLWANPAGMTMDEVCAAADRPRYSLQPRLSELKRLGSIYDTGARRLTVSGARAIVWAATALRKPSI